MGERRKRKSLWDQEGTKQSSGVGENNSWAGKEHDSHRDIGRNSGFSASRSYSESRDLSGQPSVTSITNTPVAPMHGSFVKIVQETSEGKEVGGGNRVYQNMSLGFDGTGQDKHKQNLGNDRGHSDRYTRRGRSRSRSRSRTRDRSRSSSLSRGRERGRSRSRSSSRSDGSARGRMRSRSPGGDYRHQSHGWSDKRSAPDRSSRICRDFLAGKCRRGIQCRFYHPKSASHGDSEALGDNTGESQRDTLDYGQISKSSFSKGPQSDLQGDVSDPYHRQDERFRNKSKSAVPCKDFIKGRCRWGDTCRFAHHLDNDVRFEKSTRRTSISKDIEQQPDKNGKIICKYFAAGDCDRDNCRFSHENPRLNSLDGRQDEAAKDTKSHDMNSWSHPTSNDASRNSDNVKRGGWSETIGTVTNSIGEPTEAKNDNRWGHVLENENKGWKIPQWPDTSVNVDEQPFAPRTIGGYVGGMETVESIGKEELANKPEHLRLHRSHLQNLEGNAKVEEQIKVLEDPKYMELGQQHVPPILHVQQKHHGVVENNLATSLMSGALDELKNLGNTAQSSLLSGQNLNQNGENVFTGLSSISDGTDSGQNMLSHIPTIESSGNLNMHEMHQAAPLNLESHSQMQNHLKADQISRILETKLPHFLPNLLANQHSSLLADSTVAIIDQHVAPPAIPSKFPNQGLVNEQARKSTDLDFSNPQGVAPFSDISGNVPLGNAANVSFNQVRVSHDPKESGRDINEHGNRTERDSGMKVGQSYPLPIAGKEPDDLKGGRSGNQKLNQETLHTDPEVDKTKGDNGNENKAEQNNKHPAAVNSNGEVEEKVSKDDKAMRPFKNSLIEFVKDILKPTWKEGQMSREVHKSIVKKVVDKVTSTIQADHIPNTQDKVEQYLSYSKPKIDKLVQAYVARCLKTDSGHDI